MKRKSWLFLLYTVLIITAIVLLLVFLPKKSKGNTTNHNNPVIEQEKEENGKTETPNGGEDNTTEDTEKEEDNIYANSLEIDLPDAINLLKGTTATLLGNYIKVEPAEMVNSVTIEIIPKYNSNPFGLKIENNILEAKEKGMYNLTFSVSQSATSKITKSVSINIFEEKANAHIYQIENLLIKGESKNIRDLFIIKDNVEYLVTTTDHISYLNGVLTAKKIGNGILEVNVIGNNVTYHYKFELIVKEQPLYSIVLHNAQDNRIDIVMSNTSVFFINYEIQNRQEEYVSQEILLIIEDESVIQVENAIAPLIKIRGIKEGETTLSIICGADNSVRIDIVVVVGE